MRVTLPLPDDVVPPTRPLATRPFVPGQRRGGLGRDQQPCLRRPPRTGRVDRGRAARAHGGRLGRPRRLPRGRRPGRARSDRGLLDQGPPRPLARARRDLRDRRRPAPPRAGLGTLPHGGRAGAPGRPRHHASACSTPTPPTRPPSRSTGRSASPSTTSTVPTGGQPRPAAERAGWTGADAAPVSWSADAGADRLADAERDAGCHNGHSQLPEGRDQDGPLGEAGQHDAHDHARPPRRGRPTGRWPPCPR